MFILYRGNFAENGKRQAFAITGGKRCPTTYHPPEGYEGAQRGFAGSRNGQEKNYRLVSPG
jgi:hypothetical protein